MSVAALSTYTWRDKVTGARGYSATHSAPTATKSFAKAANDRPTRRGVPPH
ncbi:MAG: hypothetical protein ACK5O2_08315 [Microthrixaceae bacterium]